MSKIYFDSSKKTGKEQSNMAVKSDHVPFVSEFVFVIIYTQVEIPLFPHLFLVSSVLNFYLHFCFVLYCFFYIWLALLNVLMLGQMIKIGQNADRQNKLI